MNNIKNYMHIYGVTQNYIKSCSMSVFVGGDWIGDEDGDALDEIFANNIVGLYSKDSDSNTWNKIDDDIAFEKAIIKVGQASEGDWLGS